MNPTPVKIQSRLAQLEDAGPDRILDLVADTKRKLGHIDVRAFAARLVKVFAARRKNKHIADEAQQQMRRIHRTRPRTHFGDSSAYENDIKSSFRTGDGHNYVRFESGQFVRTTLKADPFGPAYRHVNNPVINAAVDQHFSAPANV